MSKSMLVSIIIGLVIGLTSAVSTNWKFEDKYSALQEQCK